MVDVKLHLGDNLETLARLVEQDAKFDLVELDGPYMAGLEDWDSLTEEQYIEHYAERLRLVRLLLQPWGVVFIFGYPEGCAEIKTWARTTGTLYLRRWLTWYKQITAHKGRKVEVVLLFEHEKLLNPQNEFKVWFRGECKKNGITEKKAKELCGIRGNFAISGRLPSKPEYLKLKDRFTIPDYFDILLHWRSYDDITNIDFLSKTYSEDTSDLNEKGLRSKPVGLYLDLFTSTVPPTEHKRALILYGGSGNAGIAAGALGYDVDICEISAERCELIQTRYGAMVARWREKVIAKQPTLLDAQMQTNLFEVTK